MCDPVFQASPFPFSHGFSVRQRATITCAAHVPRPQTCQQLAQACSLGLRLDRTPCRKIWPSSYPAAVITQECKVDQDLCLQSVLLPEQTCCLRMFHIFCESHAGGEGAAPAVLGLTVTERQTDSLHLSPPPNRASLASSKTGASWQFVAKSRWWLWIGQPAVQRHPTVGQQELLPQADASDHCARRM